MLITGSLFSRHRFDLHEFRQKARAAYRGRVSYSEHPNTAENQNLSNHADFVGPGSAVVHMLRTGDISLSIVIDIHVRGIVGLGR